MESYFSGDGLRAILVVVFAVGQALMAYWPELRRWPDTIASRSARLQNPVTPAAWAFAIWGVIFFGCLAFAVWQALPGHLDDPLSRRIGWLAVALFAGNVLWEAYVPRRDLDGISVAIILVELGLVLTILFAISGAGPLDATRFWLVSAPFQIFAGWVSAAAFVNAASALQRAGVAVDRRLSIAMILAAGALGSAIAWSTGAWFYAAAVAWALFGVVMANALPDRRAAVAAVAGALIPVVFGSALLPMLS